MTQPVIQQLFEPFVLTAAAQVVYTAPAATQNLKPVIVGGRVRFANTSAGSVTVTAYAVPANGSPGAGNTFIPGVSIAANAYLDSDLPVLGPGDSFQALASAVTSITVTQLAGILYQ